MKAIQKGRLFNALDMSIFKQQRSGLGQQSQLKHVSPRLNLLLYQHQFGCKAEEHQASWISLGTTEAAGQTA